jgi:hypothetical protein
MIKQSAQAALAEEVAKCYHDPLRFVQMMYPWGEPGFLQPYDGPDVWQREFLQHLGRAVRQHNFTGRIPVPPIRMGVSSGHGIGKSTMVAWIVNWIMSTRPHAKGTITANTFTQLRDKSWASIQRWTKLSLTRDWFTVTSDRMYHTNYKDSWFCSAQSCKEENSEAFSGQHAADSTSFYIVDESSAVPDKIFEVAEGGLTDGEPMIFVFGNPTRSSGAFHRICFGALRKRWYSVQIDSRECAFTNKTQLKEWADDYGEDSDFYRVRVRGLPPGASDLQFISSESVFDAQMRPPMSLSDDALVCGLDVARGGDDHSVFRFRCGGDARSVPPIRLAGEETRDTMRLVTLAADVLERDFDGRRVGTMFVDGTGIGGPIVDRLRQLGHRNVVEVQFGAKSPSTKFANMRSYMWGKCRDWLKRGAIDKTPQLETDLTGPGYKHDGHDRVILESKEQMKGRGIDSPDDGDALALTFAASTIQRRVPFLHSQPSRNKGWRSWMS